jgi:tetratricopeptide (TPR) repeat protein
MTGTFDDTNRQVIPRCLNYATACSLGLLRIIRKQEQSGKSEVQSSHASLEWQNNPNLAAAVDLVGEALILKDFSSDEAMKAAHYILSEAPASSLLIIELANHFLEQPSSDKITISPTMQIEAVSERIARLKKSVRWHPMNPIAWSDMSLEYATLGQIEKARLAMEVALNLGRGNRFILRSAARCFVHVGEPDRAVKILNRSGLCPSDPWIASAEIAIADSAGLTSKCLSKAKHMVQDDNLTRFSRSELTVGLGTMEMKHGSTRRAKTLMRQSILDPTENALAQAGWMATQLRTDIANIVELGAKVPASYEAQARHYYYSRKFADSLKALEMWSRFQPLSSSPTILSSFIASVCLNDDAEALRILNNCIPAQQNDPLLINNRAFSLARSGDIPAAVQALSKINFRVLTDRQKSVLTATQGLISFRMNNVEEGREYYSSAVREFERINDPHSAAIAAYFWAVEEKRIGSPHAASQAKDAKRRINRFNVFELEHLIKSL